MNKVNLIFNIVLLVLVGILFYWHLNAPGKGAALISQPPAASSIVYINTDSLLDNYEFYKIKKVEFEARNEEMKNKLKSESDKLQRDAERYQQQASGMTDEQRMKTEEQLMMRQQNLVKQKDEMLEAFDEEQGRFNEELYQKLHGFLKQFNQDMHYTFILGYQKGGGILLASDSLDITQHVLDGMNAEFKKSK